MHSRVYNCVVLEASFITPTVVRVVFEPSRKIYFKPGQFISLIIPSASPLETPVKRPYSFANSFEVAEQRGYELCVKYVRGGKGSEFVASLRKGDTFKISASHGVFTYQIPEHHKSVCFIGTGTGIAPLRSIIQSKVFSEHRPQEVHAILGVRNEAEILFKSDFENTGIKTKYALSQSSMNWSGFKGRVSDYLREHTHAIDWRETDFYICGNGLMIQEVVKILKYTYGVKDSSIFKENFSLPQAKVFKFESPTKTEEKENLPFLQKLRIAK